jgi:hypothetical protein
MVEDLPDVPPALLLLAEELPSCESLVDMRRRIKGMLRDLRDQSEAFASESIGRRKQSKDPLRFEIHLDGALDLLSGKGCQGLPCRVAAAGRIARSVGLIADRVWLTDLLSEKFIDFGRPTNAKLDDVLYDFTVLAPLLPLIQAGIVRFRSPWFSTCEDCATYFAHQVENTAKDLSRTFSSEFRIEKHPGGGFMARTGRCIEPPLMSRSISREMKRVPSARKFAENWIGDQVRGSLWTAREASLTGGSVFSNSRIGLAGLLHNNGRNVDLHTLLLLDKEREFSVPWVSDLDASQILQLREEASSALPAFRERMARAMSVSSSDSLPSTDSSDVIADLREQAADVRAELETKQKYSARYWKVAYGLLGLGISAYGVAADQLLPGVGGLLPVIQLLINHKTGHEAEVAKLTSTPGFVLVKARDILSHAQGMRHDA